MFIQSWPFPPGTQLTVFTSPSFSWTLNVVVTQSQLSSEALSSHLFICWQHLSCCLLQCDSCCDPTRVTLKKKGLNVMSVQVVCQTRNEGWPCQNRLDVQYTKSSSLMSVGALQVSLCCVICSFSQHNNKSSFGCFENKL